MLSAELQDLSDFFSHDFSPFSTGSPEVLLPSFLEADDDSHYCCIANDICTLATVLFCSHFCGSEMWRGSVRQHTLGVVTRSQ